MTPDRIAELRALAEAATPGPWFAQIQIPEDTALVSTSVDPHADDSIVEDGTFRSCDAIFIAAARTALPEALDAIERVRSVPRFDEMNDYNSYGEVAGSYISERSDGDWVRYDDVLAALEGKSE